MSSKRFSFSRNQKGCKQFSTPKNRCINDILQTPNAPRASSMHVDRSYTCLADISPASKDSEEEVKNKVVPKTHMPRKKSFIENFIPKSKYNMEMVGAPRFSLVDSLKNSSNDPGSDQLSFSTFCQIQSNNQSGRNSVGPSPNTSYAQELRCRICLEEGRGPNNEELMSPCRCKGTVGLLHKTCLREWLVSSKQLKCELCGYKYVVKRSTVRHKQMRIQASLFRTWLQSKIAQRNIVTDSIFSVLLFIALTVLTYLCIRAMITYWFFSPWSWQIFGLALLLFICVSMFLVWMIVAVKYHWKSYQRHKAEMALREEEESRWNISVQPRPRGSSHQLESSDVSNRVIIEQQNTTPINQLSTLPELSEVHTMTEEVSQAIEIHSPLVPLDDSTSSERRKQLGNISVNDSDIIL